MRRARFPSSRTAASGAAWGRGPAPPVEHLPVPHHLQGLGLFGEEGLQPEGGHLSRPVDLPQEGHLQDLSPYPGPEAVGVGSPEAPLPSRKG